MKRMAFLIFVAHTVAATMSGASIYEQAVAEILASRFSSSTISYLVLDVRTGTVAVSRWEGSARPVPLGSLIKPFTALAYAQRHEFKYPEFICRGADSGCWLPRGHGRIDMAQAIAFSCNAYFRALARNVNPEDVSAVMHRFELHTTSQGLPTRAMVGLGNDWEATPEQIARAYCQLARQSSEPGIAELLRGMVYSAQMGTGSALGRAMGGVATLAKTGTAPCRHQPRAPGDGYVIALYPADSPRLAILVRVHGVPGARAAVIGGKMLKAVVEVR